MVRETTRKGPSGAVRRKTSQPLTPMGLLKGMGVKGILLLLILGAAAFGAYFFYTAPMLRVDSVTVLGASTVKQEDVEAAANVKGKNIFFVDTQQIALAVGALEQVKKASVSRKWPNIVVVEITERQPFGIWETKNARYVIDDEGKVIAQAGPGDSGTTVYDTESPTVSLGGQVNIEALRLAQVLDQRLSTEIGAKPVRYEHSSKSGLTVVTDKGWRACFGDSEDLDFKLSTLKAILNQTGNSKTKVDFVDLRFGMRPYVRIVTSTK